MPEETRDIAVEARTEIRSIKQMLEDHIKETKAHRVEMSKTLKAHNDLIQQAKGAGTTLKIGIGAASLVGGAFGAKLGKFFGF